jgi:hypothetical protein
MEELLAYVKQVNSRLQLGADEVMANWSGEELSRRIGIDSTHRAPLKARRETDQLSVLVCVVCAGRAWSDLDFPSFIERAQKLTRLILSEDMGMTMQDVTNRRLFEAFNAEPKFEEIRKTRLQLQGTMEVFRNNIQSYRQGKTPLTPEKSQWIREYILQMLQLQYAMTQTCVSIPDEFDTVKKRILADFDMEEPLAYMKQVNSWLQLTAGSN